VEWMLMLHRQTPTALTGTLSEAILRTPKSQSAGFRGGGRTPQEQEMVKREIESFGGQGD